MLTLTATRAAAARVLTLRAEISERKAEADRLSADLRDALPRWGGAVNTGARTVFLSAGSERKGWDADSLVTLAQSLGATPEQIDACRTVTTVAPAVRDRAPRDTDR